MCTGLAVTGQPAAVTGPLSSPDRQPPAVTGQVCQRTTNRRRLTTNRDRLTSQPPFMTSQPPSVRRRLGPSPPPPPKKIQKKSDARRFPCLFLRGSVLLSQVKADLEKARIREWMAVHRRLQDLMLAYPVRMENFWAGGRTTGGVRMGDSIW